MTAGKKAALKKPAARKVGSGKAKGRKRAAKEAGAFDIFSGALKATLDLNIFVAPLMAIVLGIIAFIAIAIVSGPFIVAGIMFSASGTVGIAPMVALLAIGVLILLVLIVVSSAIISGFYYKSIDEYLSSKKISIEKNIKSAIKEWKRLVAVYLVEALVSLAIAVIVIVPAIAFAATSIAISGDAVSAAVSSQSTAALIAALGPALAAFGAMFALLMAIMFFISPLLFLWFPTAALEKRPAMECIRKGYARGRAKYGRNLFALFLMGVLGCFVAMLQMLDPTYLIGLILSIWLELASIVMIVKIYRETA